MKMAIHVYIELFLHRANIRLLLNIKRTVVDVGVLVMDMSDRPYVG